MSFKSNNIDLDVVYVKYTDLNDYNKIVLGEILYYLNSTYPSENKSTVFPDFVNWKTIGISTLHAFIAIDSSNKLWGWGENGYGQLGLGDIADRVSPVQIGSSTNWSTISVTAVYGSTFAIDTSGYLWSWGINNVGQLGSGVTTSRSSPVKVGALTDWNKIVSGYEHTLAIKTDGTLWSWGYNNYGQLGLSDITNRSSPVKIGSSTNWNKIYSGGESVSFAIDNSGYMWSWGYNGSGELGLGDRTNRSSPVKVGSLTDWNSVSIGGYNSTTPRNFVLATKTDGTLWSWGYNISGQLGSGVTTSVSSPVKVGTLTNWNSVCTGQAHSLAIKTDGTLWAWGENSNGQLGLGDMTDRLSPVKIGSLTNWTKIYTNSGNLSYGVLNVYSAV